MIAKSFFRSTKLEQDDVTQTDIPAFILRRRKDDELPLSPLSDEAAARKIEPSALEELKKLADSAVKKTAERYKVDYKVTHFIPAIQAKQATYTNSSLSPYMLVLWAIMENRRYYSAKKIPSAIYVSDNFLPQLTKDMYYTLGRIFDGRTFTFYGPDGMVDIPIFSAKKITGIDIPYNSIICNN